LPWALAGAGARKRAHQTLPPVAAIRLFVAFLAGNGQFTHGSLLSLPTLFAPIADDMQSVDGVIRARLASDVPLIRTIADYIIGAGGKRMRPALLLMMARALGYEGRQHHLLAAVVEFIHTATLLHDDVVD